MSNFDFLNIHRLRVGQFGTSETDGFNGAFRFNLPGEVRPVHIIASDGEGWQHVSVSFGPDSKKCPSWEVMCAVKDLFWEPEDVVIQIHPRKSEYVTYHPGCLHLWRCTDGREQPTPPSIMVGPMNEKPTKKGNISGMLMIDGKCVPFSL
jgi:hypothetical protein